MTQTIGLAKVWTRQRMAASEVIKAGKKNKVLDCNDEDGWNLGSWMLMGSYATNSTMFPLRIFLLDPHPNPCPHHLESKKARHRDGFVSHGGFDRSRMMCW